MDYCLPLHENPDKIIFKAQSSGFVMASLSRRRFLAASTFVLGVSGRERSTNLRGLNCPYSPIERHGSRPPAFSITPVVSDGKWIWDGPPSETGYLEPREFEFSIKMRFTGTGQGTGLSASTVAPVDHPEQEILDFRIETENCSAEIVRINRDAAQLVMFADTLPTGVVAVSTARYRLKIYKSYMGYNPEQFPAEQPRVNQAPKQYLLNSPGINVNAGVLKEIVRSVAPPVMHPWHKAKQFYDWVWENIAGVPGEYTSVELAIKNRSGDCEERACTFIAFCRAAGIPARQVWIPSHVWAEFALHDHDGNWHWIPVHTAAYDWFGWTGVHEVVLQKGDRIHIKSRRKNLRLIDDWYQIKGPRPIMEFTATCEPIATNGQDSGPGGRRKMPDGQWQPTGKYRSSNFVRR